MVSKQYPRVGETVFHEILENGLHIYVDRRRDFQKSYAFFATNYGGMDMRFKLDGAWKNTPAGVAHFLEHKMFDTEDGNALQDLAANGASPNAFTSSAITGYFFESTEKFFDNLKILLSFVSVPYFTQESVDKEQGIIGQEIRMYEDDPDWEVYLALMEAMYKSHPVRENVAGSVESISHITADTLYACHKAFYDPANMTLCVAGPVDPRHICEVAREILPKTPGPIAAKDYGQKEPPQAAKELVEMEMEVSAPIFQLGVKGDAPGRGEDGQLQQLVAELALEVLLGTSSPLYARLYRQGLINQSFTYGYESFPGCSFLCAGGESKDPAQVRQAVLEEASRLVREGIDRGLWERVKKGSYGAKVRALNSFEQLCVGQAQAFFQGGAYLDFARLFDAVTMEQAQKLLEEWVTPSRTALSVVRPKGGAD